MLTVDKWLRLLSWWHTLSWRSCGTYSKRWLSSKCIDWLANWQFHWKCLLNHLFINREEILCLLLGELICCHILYLFIGWSKFPVDMIDQLVLWLLIAVLADWVGDTSVFSMVLDARLGDSLLWYVELNAIKRINGREPESINWWRKCWVGRVSCILFNPSNSVWERIWARRIESQTKEKRLPNRSKKWTEKGTPNNMTMDIDIQQLINANISIFKVKVIIGNIIGLNACDECVWQTDQEMPYKWYLHLK